jgi:hypothetical protein
MRTIFPCMHTAISEEFVGILIIFDIQHTSLFIWFLDVCACKHMIGYDLEDTACMQRSFPTPHIRKK